MLLLKARLQASNDQLSSGQENGDQLRSQLLRLEDEAEKLKVQLCDVEKERSTIQDQLGKRTQELDASHQQSSTLLSQKDDIIKGLQEDLNRSGSDLNVALEKARDLQQRLDARFVEMEELRAELHRVREESEQRDAANEELDDRRFDAEVALANDRRTFQEHLVEQSLEAEARLQHKDNLLTEALAQMAKDREEYQITISTTPDAGFRLLRVVNLEASRIRIRDRILSVQGADELLTQLELANHDLHQYALLISMAWRVLPLATYSSVREAWHLHQVLWVLPKSSFNDVREFWAKSSGWNGMDELERQGFSQSPTDWRLLYSNPESRRKPLLSEGNDSRGRK